jgi:hypothetical protein
MGTNAVARREDAAVQLAESAAVGTLPVEVQHALELRKLQNQVAGQLAAMNWGKGLDLPTRRALADWGQRYHVDVTTEIDVLGSNIYLNARYYLRRLGDLVAAGLVEYAFADHVEDDKRLARLGADGEGEITRRLRERIKYGIPDAAAGAVVFRVKLRSMEREIVGVNWCGGGTRKSDPVGEAEPIKTAESRAARRAMRMVASHVPQEYRAQFEGVEAETDAVSARIAESHAALAREVQPRLLGAVQRPGYGEGIEAPRVEITGSTADPALVEHFASQPDPYTGEAGELPLDDARQAPRAPSPQSQGE